MTRDRSDDGRISQWLQQEAPDQLPDRVLRATFERTRASRQRRTNPWWRPLPMTRLIPTGIAVGAAAIVIAIAGVAILPRSNQSGGGGGEPTASSSSIPTATPTATPTIIRGIGPIEPGRYQLGGAGISSLVPIAVTVPAGWSSWVGRSDPSGVPRPSDPLSVGKDYGDSAGPGLMYWEIENTFVDPCTDHTLVEPPPGPSVEALIDALGSMPGTSAGQATDVTIDGYRGKYVEVTVTTDIKTCGADGFWLWASPGDRRYVQDTNEIDRIYVLDVDGERLTFAAVIPPRTTAADRAELEAAIASIDIEP